MRAGVFAVVSLLGVVATPVLATPALAADLGAVLRPSVNPGWSVEAGGRYWYSSGRNAYDYFAGTPSTTRISRLDYDGLDAHSGEAFFRLDHFSGLFLKGYVGAGTTGGGTLYDEDFPPLFTPYSKTDSEAKGRLLYGNLDVG